MQRRHANPAFQPAATGSVASWRLAGLALAALLAGCAADPTPAAPRATGAAAARAPESRPELSRFDGIYSGYRQTSGSGPRCVAGAQARVQLRVFDGRATLRVQDFSTGQPLTADVGTDGVLRNGTSNLTGQVSGPRFEGRSTSSQDGCSHTYALTRS
ncbi:hypothetical protein M0638_22710 [Roseomonas sp. NAR14]|uniref:Lipoprotein n=1 Tax=Roseomonas acroporae TaxID=2937791 RepID=A0A9X1YBP7_9PROT|nr:hypothetical protein [Roseomonas acroporae]MCK8787188.1 hypothetical protein [Roseomonas acroporae]